VVRPLPHLACFLFAALCAHVGLAAADSAGREAQAQAQAKAIAGEDLEPVARAEHARSGPLHTLEPEPYSPQDRPSQPAWKLRIQERLDALRTEEETRGTAAGLRSTSTSTASNADVRRRLSTLSARAGGRLGIHVHDLATDRSLFDRAGDARLNPASNHKLVTAIASAELLGADYSFETRIERSGDTLYVIGEGDPSLQARDLYDLAGAALQGDDVDGIRAIVIDDSAFTGAQVGPGYRAQDDGASYQAPSGALSLAFNTVEITVAPGPYNGPALVTVNPPSAAVEVRGHVHTGHGRALRITSERGEGGTTIVHVRGSVPAGKAPQTIRRRVGDPGLFTGGAFAKILADRSGGAALPVSRGRSPSGATILARHRSQPLHAVLGSALKYSNNFTTEQVLRTLGWRSSATPGSWENGAAAIRELWSAIGNDPADLTFENGSGLSTTGRVTPRALVRLLALTRRQGSAASQLLSAFASPGGEGTLRLRLTQAKDRVRGKTGTIGGVSALSGLVNTDDGRHALAFSILVNGRQDLARSRQLQDQIVLALVEHLDRVDGGITAGPST